MPTARLTSLALAAWWLAVIGYWAPWLPRASAALQLSGFELSEWVTLLPEAREPGFGTHRLTLLAPLACLAVLGVVLASRLRARAAIGAHLAMATVFSLSMLPPYPHVLNSLNDPELKPQLLICLGTLLGAIVATLLASRSERFTTWTATALGFAAIGYGTTAIVALRGPYERLFRQPFLPAWGWWLMVVATGVAIGILWLEVARGDGREPVVAHREP